MRAAAAAVALLLLPTTTRALAPLVLTTHQSINDKALSRANRTRVRELRRLGASAARLIQAVAFTTVASAPIEFSFEGIEATPVGEDVVGPFEAGFTSTQDFVIEMGFGCPTPSACYSGGGGTDTKIAEATCAEKCGIALPRWEGAFRYAMLDTCGGHTHEYHFHQFMTCLYDDAAGGFETWLRYAGGNFSRRFFGSLPDVEVDCWVRTSHTDASRPELD